MWSGNRPTSSANMQKTSRLTKCATICGSWPRSRNACATAANDAAARSVRDCRVSPGRSRSGLENAHLSRSRVAAPARSSSSNSCVWLTLFVQLVRIRNRTMSETIKQRRVLERQRVLAELLEGGVEVGAPSLVFPREVVALPDVRPAVAARVLARAALEAVRLAGRIGLDRCRLAQQPAQVDEVLLRGRALLQLRGPPLGDELVRCHAAALGPRRLSHALTPLCAGAAHTRQSADPPRFRPGAARSSVAGSARPVGSSRNSAPAGALCRRSPRAGRSGSP